jgi:hypothetical protein
VIDGSVRKKEIGLTWIGPLHRNAGRLVLRQEEEVLYLHSMSEQDIFSRLLMLLVLAGDSCCLLLYTTTTCTYKQVASNSSQYYLLVVVPSTSSTTTVMPTISTLSS